MKYLAAHCVDGTYDKEIFALLGRHNFNNEKERHWVKRNIIQRINHGDYKSPSEDMTHVRSLADIGILLMDHPVAFSDYILPICLPVDTEGVFGVEGVVAGHGQSGPNAAAREKSQFVNLKSVDLLECILSKPHSLQIVSKNSFCAGSLDGLPCFGKMIALMVFIPSN